MFDVGTLFGRRRSSMYLSSGFAFLIYGAPEILRPKLSSRKIEEGFFGVT